MPHHSRTTVLKDLKAAKALGLTIPQTLLLRADEGPQMPCVVSYDCSVKALLDPAKVSV